MSDASEVKRWETISIDTKISGTMPDVDGVPRVTVVSASDHDRVVAELKAENEILKSKASQFESTLKETMRVRDAEIERLKKEDAAMVQRLHTQSKIMANLEDENERLKRALVDIANKNTCWRLYQIDKYKSYEDGWEGVAEFAAKVLKELEAIKKRDET